MKRIISNIEATDDIVRIAYLKSALRDSENNFSQLFNSSRTPQWIYDRHSLLVLLVNDAAINQYGYSAKEFLNMTILQLAPREEMQKLILYNEFMKTTTEPFSAVNSHQKKNREPVLVESTYSNISYGTQPCVLVTSGDITEKARLDKKIAVLKVNRQQRITLATINGQEMERDQISKALHDNIGQLLSAVKLYLEFALADEESRIDFIGRGEKMLAIAINEVKSLSNSMVPLSLKDIGFKDALTELFETYLATKTFNIQLSFEKELETLDQEIKISLFRIIQEQLDNILKHARAKNVIINLASKGEIGLSIKDDGKGFDTVMINSGHGILNMKNRVELYNGTVKILSKPQQGCTLLVNIPYKKNKESKASINVLVVEDDPDDREAIARAFAEVAPDYNINWLNDSSMLVELLQSFADNELPSLIVLDYNMPLLNGLETLKALELDQRYNKIPKIIYSNSSQNSIKNLCYSANAKAYITKGITRDEIKENIQEMLSFV